MKPLTVEQREWVFQMVRWHIGSFDLTDTFVDAITANTEEDKPRHIPFKDLDLPYQPCPCEKRNPALNESNK